MSDESNVLKRLELTYKARFAEISGRLSSEDDAAIEAIYVKPNALRTINRATSVSKDRTESTETQIETSLLESLSLNTSRSKTLGKVLRDNQYLVLLGEPGSGKSTTLQFMAWCFARDGIALDKLDLPEQRVPILLTSKTNYWRDIENEDVEFALRKEISRYLRTDEENAPDLIRSWLTQGKLIVLVDGIDEIPETSREHVVHKLHLFASADDYKGCRVVVSSRSANYLPLGRPFAEFTLQQFAGNDLIRLATAWLAVTKNIGSEEAAPLAANLVNRIRAQRGLRTILGNPLFIKLLIVIDPNPNELPQNVGKVIGEFIRAYAWARAKKGRDTRWTFDECHKVLTSVAWMLQNHPEKDTDEARLVDLIEKNHPNAKAPRELLGFIREGMEILEVSQFSRIVRFTHAIIREYFVAWRLSEEWEKDSKQTWRFIKTRLHQQEWREPFFLLSLILDPSHSQQYVSRIVRARSRDERILHRDKLLAARCLMAGAKASSRLRTQITRALLELYLGLLEDLGHGRPAEMPSTASKTRIVLETFLRSMESEGEDTIEEVLATRISSGPRKLYLREMISIVWSEIFVTSKLMFRSLIRKPHEDRINELYSYRDELPFGTRTARQLKTTEHYVWRGRVRAAIQAVGSLRSRSPRMTRMLIERLGDWRFFETSVIALSNQSVATLDVARAVINALYYHHTTEESYKHFINFHNIIEYLGVLAQKNDEIVERFINYLNQSLEEDIDKDEKERRSNLMYPIAFAICKAAETNLVAFEFVLNYWNNPLERRDKKFDRDLHEGMKAGTEGIRTASEDIIKYTIDQIKGYQKHTNHAPKLLEQILGEIPKVMQKESDGTGNTWYVSVDMSESQIEEFQEAILQAITLHPPIGTLDETPLIAIITRWALESPSFLIRLVSMVASSDAQLLAENLSHYASPEEAGRWGLDKNDLEFVNSIIRRLRDPDVELSRREIVHWQEIANRSKSMFSLAAWSMHVVKWQKCNFFYEMYLQTFGVFWMEGMGLGRGGGWQRIGKWNPYSMAALVSFSDWGWSSPGGRPQNNVHWNEVEAEFRRGTDLAISFIKTQDNRVLGILKSLVTARSPGNPDESIFGDGPERRHAKMDERIAAIYSLARLSRDLPEVIEFLFPMAQELSDTYIDDWEDAPVPFSEFREHLIRSLGYVFHPNREMVRLMWETMKKDRHSNLSYITIIERGLEAIENPSSEAAQYLVDEYEKTDNPYWKETILKSLGTVKTPTPRITRIMLTALGNGSSDRSKSIAAAYFDNLRDIETSVIDQLMELSKKSVQVLEVLGNQTRHLSKYRLRRLAKTARMNTKEIDDEYSSVLSKFEERLSELTVLRSPRELELVAVPIPLAFMRGTFLLLAVVLLLGLLVALGTIYGAAQSTIQEFLGQAISQWISAQPPVFIALFLGLGVLIGLLSWLVEKLKNKL